MAMEGLLFFGRCLRLIHGIGMYWAYWNQKLAMPSPKLGVAHVLQSLADKPQEWAQEHYGHPNIEFRYADYRDAEGLYDRVYSVGMFEHVGRKSFATYFDKVQLALCLKRVSIFAYEV